MSRLLKALRGSVFLEPLSWVYRAGVGAHHSLYGRGRRLPRPVVSIGNLTWGGTGKTPLVLWLAEELRSAGKSAAVLMRGYGRDEVKLFESRRIRVAAGKDRLKAGLQLLEKETPDIFLLDDGFQHWPLFRDMDIVCLNATKPFGNGKLIPRGPLREPRTALKRAQIIVLTHADQIAPESLAALEKEVRQINPEISVAWASHEPSGIFNWEGREESVKGLKGKPYFLLSGIGDPSGFWETASKFLGQAPEKEFRFRDHHPFRKNELKRIEKEVRSQGAFCLVTEKDWVRSRELFEEFDCFKTLKITIAFLKGKERLLDRVLSPGSPKKVRVAVLSDGKPGHVKQSLALLELLKEESRTSGRVEVVREETVEIRYKSPMHRHFFWLITPILNYFEKEESVIGLFGHFLTESSAEKLKDLETDIVISTGSSLLPVQHILKRRRAVKSVVIMKPTGLYGSCPWDLVVQPSHDGETTGKNIVSTRMALGRLPKELLDARAKTFDERLSLGGKKGISLFVGGSASGYRFSPELLHTAIEHTRSFASARQVPFFVTTSRRSSPEVNRIVKRLCEKDPFCKLLVIPSEREVPDTVETMLGLSHTALVTEESISMVSEALRSGRHVISLSVGEKPLKGKKKQFQSSLRTKGWIRVSDPQELFSNLEAVQEKPLRNFSEEDDIKIRERLLTIL